MLGNEVLNVAIFLCSVLIVLPIQLWLCFKVKRPGFRVLPAILLALCTLFLFVMSTLTKDWDSVGYILLSVYSGALLAFDGVAWGVYAIIRLVKKGGQGN